MYLPHGSTGRATCRQLTVQGSPPDAAVQVSVSEPGPGCTSIGAGARLWASSARLWNSPAEIEATSPSPPTWIGACDAVVVPLPSWPTSLAPQASTPPPLTDRLKRQPA